MLVPAHSIHGRSPSSSFIAQAYKTRSAKRASIVLVEMCVSVESIVATMATCQSELTAMQKVSEQRHTINQLDSITLVVRVQRYAT